MSNERKKRRKDCNRRLSPQPSPTGVERNTSAERYPIMIPSVTSFFECERRMYLLSSDDRNKRQKSIAIIISYRPRSNTMHTLSDKISSSSSSHTARGKVFAFIVMGMKEGKEGGGIHAILSSRDDCLILLLFRI